MTSMTMDSSLTTTPSEAICRGCTLTDAASEMVHASPSGHCRDVKFHAHCLPVCLRCCDGVSICRGDGQIPTVFDPRQFSEELFCVYCRAGLRECSTSVEASTACSHGGRAHVSCLPSCQACTLKQYDVQVPRGNGSHPRTDTRRYVV